MNFRIIRWTAVIGLLGWLAWPTWPAWYQSRLDDMELAKDSQRFRIVRESYTYSIFRGGKRSSSQKVYTNNWEIEFNKSNGWWPIHEYKDSASAASNLKWQMTKMQNNAPERIETAVAKTERYPRAVNMVRKIISDRNYAQALRRAEQELMDIDIRDCFDDDDF